MVIGNLRTLATGMIGGAALAAALTGSAAAQSSDPIRVGLDWAWRPYHAPFILALGKGYYEDAGLDVMIEEGRGSNNTALLVGQGNYDLGHMNITNAAHAISKGMPLKVVAVYQPKTAASFIGKADTVDLDSVDDLKKYRIGSTPGGSDQLSLAIFQKENDIGDDELNVISMDASNKTAALLSDQIDVVSGDSYAYKAIVANAGHEPEAFLLADHGVPLLGFGFVVNTEVEEELGDDIRTFLEVTKKAWQEVAADPDAACVYIKEQRELPGSQQQCVDYVTNLLELSHSPSNENWGRQSDEQWTKLLQTLEDVGEIPGGWNVGDYYTNKYIP